MKKQFLLSLALLSGAASATTIAYEPLAIERINAYRVLTQQNQAAVTANITNMQRVAEGMMASLAIQASLTDQMQVYRNFSPLIGQGAQVCDAINTSTDIDQIGQVRQRFDLGNVSNAGRVKLAANNYTRDRVKTQLDKYCTADQHNLGLCRASFDGMAGASSDFGLLMRKEQFTRKDYEASNEFVANMVPAPNQAIQSAKCSANACPDLIARTRSLDSFSSMAAYSFSQVFASRVGNKTYASMKPTN